ncbi:phosphonatase-like hydrolase [Chitinophaga jiangningensis]|uniref:Phosphonatase-like hydrolase n=2 Tax=Chitinophaga jiangningensis TaxID=1419482 RepID=A0A1M6ZYT9_9BACT|nr:phosphonatase-like hydrolase [Chitinophaga jiangningensis]
MAGTTVNEDNVVYKTVRDAVNARGFDFTLDEVLAVGAGKEKLQAIRSVLALRNVADEKLAQEIFADFNQLLDNAYATLNVTEQPQAAELFKALHSKGIQVALNTGYSRQVAEMLVQKIGWKIGTDIDTLVTASDVPNNRPHPDMVLYAMQQLGIHDAKEVVKVGDSGIDIEEGKNSGCALSIGITTGAQTYEQLSDAHPDYVIDQLMELLDVLDHVNQ